LTFIAVTARWWAMLRTVIVGLHDVMRTFRIVFTSPASRRLRNQIRTALNELLEPELSGDGRARA
jgi:hypothetical protein